MEYCRLYLSKRLTGFLEILVDIHNLSGAINQGRADAAVRATERLISKKVRLEAKANQRSADEELFK